MTGFRIKVKEVTPEQRQMNKKLIRPESLGALVAFL